MAFVILHDHDMIDWSCNLHSNQPKWMNVGQNAEPVIDKHNGRNKEIQKRDKSRDSSNLEPLECKKTNHLFGKDLHEIVHLKNKTQIQKAESNFQNVKQEDDSGKEKLLVRYP
uniref:Uncharacterized protein n=1 Tax=Cucumis melo TaxID=3656 RepID=A0A9I9D931_CUCME